MAVGGIHPTHETSKTTMSGLPTVRGTVSTVSVQTRGCESQCVTPTVSTTTSTTTSIMVPEFRAQQEESTMVGPESSRTSDHSVWIQPWLTIATTSKTLPASPSSTPLTSISTSSSSWRLGSPTPRPTQTRIGMKSPLQANPSAYATSTSTATTATSPDSDGPDTWPTCPSGFIGIPESWLRKSTVAVTETRLVSACETSSSTSPSTLRSIPFGHATASWKA
ncbi:hypothetical protein BD289DRAFT_473903 [Coniella lustricola]|uniref:Uncharacterized protein n=1 Tax=Coniella lustricola TaxID=2025994 RepID=A0A2T3A9K1_9PEZI|nr:hypothetical protein BD289DRAFT_473903 [Coniella lustricola]